MTTTNEKCVLLFDQDGVLANWYGRLLSRWQSLYPDRPFVKPENLKTFYVEEAYPSEYHRDLLAITRTDDFYETLEPIAGAVDVLYDIQTNCLDFIDPYICTSPDLDFEDLDCHSQKARWVDGHLGNFWLKRMILTKDKTLVRGHILIDDKPTVTGALKPVWDHLVYDSAYAGKPPNMTFTWKDWPILRQALREEFGVKEPNIVKASDAKKDPVKILRFDNLILPT